jgi:hypothetical protein
MSVRLLAGAAWAAGV